MTIKPSIVKIVKSSLRTYWYHITIGERFVVHSQKGDWFKVDYYSLDKKIEYDMETDWINVDDCVRLDEIKLPDELFEI